MSSCSILHQDFAGREVCYILKSLELSFVMALTIQGSLSQERSSLLSSSLPPCLPPRRAHVSKYRAHHCTHSSMVWSPCDCCSFRRLFVEMMVWVKMCRWWTSGFLEPATRVSVSHARCHRSCRLMRTDTTFDPGVQVRVTCVRIPTTPLLSPPVGCSKVKTYF